MRPVRRRRAACACNQSSPKLAPRRHSCATAYRCCSAQQRLREHRAARTTLAERGCSAFTTLRCTTVQVTRSSPVHALWPPACALAGGLSTNLVRCLCASAFCQCAALLVRHSERSRGRVTGAREATSCSLARRSTERRDRQRWYSAGSEVYAIVTQLATTGVAACGLARVSSRSDLFVHSSCAACHRDASDSYL